METNVITSFYGKERETYRELSEATFRLRHRIFVQQRRWSLPSRPGDLDIDQYDCPDAVYFTDTNDGQVEAHVRLTPTLTHSLMADYFPHLMGQCEPVRGERIYEATRYIVLPSRKSRESNRAAKARILAAMLEWALANELEFIQTVIDTATYPSFVEMTSDTIALGESHEYGGGPTVTGGGQCMGIRWPVTAKVLNDVRAYGGLVQSCENARNGTCRTPCTKVAA